jgi:hypothetical protein
MKFSKGAYNFDAAIANAAGQHLSMKCSAETNE